jgi:YfiH family protein
MTMGWRVERWRDVAGLMHGFGGRADAVPAGVRTLRQVHGRAVWRADDLPDPAPEGDGLALSGLGQVGVWTADCVPVLLLARRARVAAAVHAGWRGSAAGVVGEALALFSRLWSVPASEVEAALGPAIGGCCYEVGDEVRRAFVARLGERGTRGFGERGGRLTLDLREAIAAELADLGVSHMEEVGPCTACSGELLFSFRRERGPGRQLSTIGWRP